MSEKPTVLINTLTLDPARQAELIALLEQNIETVVSTLAGWRATRLVASPDGASVVIVSEWETAEAIQSMRDDPRMRAYFPQIAALASFASTTGHLVYEKAR